VPSSTVPITLAPAVTMNPPWAASQFGRSIGARSGTSGITSTSWRPLARVARSPPVTEVTSSTTASGVAREVRRT
jgi:hypothetical protein